MLKSLLLLLLTVLWASSAISQVVASDAVFDGLKGKVKTVLLEQSTLEKRSGRYIESNRRNSEAISYDANGRRLTWKSYDYLSGGLFDSVIYKMIDGDKVSVYEDIKNSSKIVAVMDPPPNEKQADPRYTYKFKYKYDASGAVSEEASWSNDGSLWLRYTYNRKNDQVLELVYTGTGELDQKIVHIYDNRGVEIETNYYDVEKDKMSEKVVYQYLAFDKQRNWTKRSEAAGDRDSGFELKPRSMQYRTITYHK